MICSYYAHLTHFISLHIHSNRNDYCDTRRNECRRATGQGCKSGTDCGDGRGSVWMCRDGRCEPRSLFELAMELVLHGEGVMFDLDQAMEEE